MSYQFFKSVHIEREGETKRLVQRARLCGSHHVGGIDFQHVEREAGTEGEVFAVTLVFVFVEVSGPQEELLVVGIFGTNRKVDFAQLLLESAGGIAERLEDTRDGRGVLPLLFGLFILGIGLVVGYLRCRGYQQFVEVEVERERVVVGQREEERGSYLQVGGQGR